MFAPTVKQQAGATVALDSLVPLPSQSKAIAAGLQIVCPRVPKLIVATTVIVTVPPTGIAPFHVAVLPAVAAVPLLALADTRVRPAGRTSVNSSPRLSAWSAGPLLTSRKV